MRSWLVLGLVVMLAGCADDADPGGSSDGDGGAGDAGGGVGAGGSDDEAPEPMAWSDSFALDFTMAAPGEVPQEGQNCVGGEFLGVEALWANVSWSPAIDLRLVIATDFGGDVVVDETGPSPLSVSVPDSVSGDQHITVALMAPEQGSAPAVEATLDLDARLGAMPAPGTAACAF